MQYKFGVGVGIVATVLFLWGHNVYVWMAPTVGAGPAFVLTPLWMAANVALLGAFMTFLDWLFDGGLSSRANDCDCEDEE